LALVERRIDKQEMAASTAISETARTVTRILPRVDGTVWVLTGRGENESPAGAMATFDVFDRAGRFVRQVTVTVEYVPGRDAFFVGGDHVVVVVNGGPMGGADIFEATDSDGIEVRCVALGGAE
jgi:hypothetical protein